MKAFWIGLFGLALFMSAAGAQVRYDEKLEAAVKSVVAARIGDIRPGLPVGGVPRGRIVVRRDGADGPPAPKAWTVVGGGEALEQSVSGSFQTFSGGTAATPAQRKAWSNKAVPRVVDF